MRISIAVLVLASFTAFTAQAKADIIATYDVTGTFQDGASLSGTVTIDTTTAVATSLTAQIQVPLSAASIWLRHPRAMFLAACISRHLTI
jgi:hypothetical protein